MVQSMTGFGRYEASDDTTKILVEIKAVNHRYLDFNIKMPRQFYLFESRIRSLMKEYASRGKIDLYISCENFSEDSGTLRYNSALAGEYMQYFRQMREEFGLPDDMTVSRLASFPDVLTREHGEEDADSLWPLLEEALRGAAERFAEQKTREGEKLRADILQKLVGMEQMVSVVEERSPQVVEDYRIRLEAKMRELLEGAEVDDTRLMTEVAAFSDKTCVDEETVRLRSHIEGMRRTLSDETRDSVGRRLDFLAQEMNREANTILSKCNDREVSSTAIGLKTEIEKIREQVQNIE